MVGVHQQAVFGRDPEDLVGRAFQVHGFALRLRQHQVVGAEAARRPQHLHGVADVGGFQHLAAHQHQRDLGGTLIVLLAGQEIAGQGHAGAVEAVARQAARLGEHQQVRTVFAAHAQHDAGIHAFFAPVPVVGMHQLAARGGLGQHDQAGATIVQALAGPSQFGVAEHHLGAAVDHHHVFQRLARPVGDAAQLFQVGGVVVAHHGHHAGGQLLQPPGAHAAALQLAPVQGDAARDALGNGGAVLAPAFIRAALYVDQGKRGRHSHAGGAPDSSDGIRPANFVLIYRKVQY
ncbi:hypothetical protein D3C72_1386270 [compost metagenome]